jgi:hypothetical protein
MWEMSNGSYSVTESFVGGTAYLQKFEVNTFTWQYTRINVNMFVIDVG